MRARAALGWVPSLVLALSLLLTAAGTWYAASTAQGRDRLRFQTQIQRIQVLLANRMETHIALLRATGALFDASDEVERDDFRLFVERLELRRRYPGVQGIGLVRRVPRGEKASFVARVRREVPGFRVWPESPQADSAVIEFLEPQDFRNRVALGFDMSSEPRRLEAMARARDTGLPSATGRITLVQEIDERKQAGLLIYLPLYRRGMPTGTAAERRAALAGFVYCPFRADDLLRDSLGAIQSTLALEVYAGETPSADSLLHRFPRVEPWPGEDPAPRFTRTGRLEIAGTPWTVRYASLPSFEAGSSRDQAWLLLGLGLAASFVLFGVTRAQVRARARAEGIARELRDEAEITETLRRVGTAMAAELDRDRLLQTITDAATRITGAHFGAFFYNAIDERGEAYTLYTLSGVPREAFAGFPMPRNTALFGPTFRGEGIVRIDDVLKDPRYGKSAPHYGMPKGHLPVRSYLAVPVISRSGEILGGLFFGHPQAGVFTERAERIVAGIAAQAAVAVDNARLYEAERRARAEAEAASQTKDQFMAALSHELRTPLTPVLAVLSRLEAGRLPERVRNGLDVIRRNVELEARLIDDLLDLTRIAQAKLELRPAVSDLREVLAHAIETAGGRETGGPKLEFEVQEGADLRLCADAPRLTQVLWNLLNNAFKFTPPEGTVRVRVWREGGEIACEVADSGIGIAPEVLPRVFDAFQQGQRTITRQFGGLGLGLAISKSIVELHKGTIAAASEGRGRGAVFTVRLPVGNVPAYDPAARQERAADEAPAPAAAAPLHILLVEDHQDTAEAMADLLRFSGRKVTVARSVTEALATAAALQNGGGAPTGAQNGHIDLVISDVGLPDGTGFELMRELSSRYRLRGIALTGYGMEDDVARGREAGFERHLTKPVNLETLDSAIRQMS